MSSNDKGIKTGFTELDQMIYGFHPADLVLIAGRPGMGKTALMRDMIRYMGVHDKRSVLLFSLADTKGQFLKKYIFSEAHICNSKHDFSKLTLAEIEECLEEILLFSKASIYVEDAPEFTVEKICEKCRIHKAKDRIDVVFIDCLQLVFSNCKNNSRKEEMFYICSKLKELAKEIDVPIVVLSQLPEDVDQRNRHRPKISDLRDLIGDGVAVFDVILFLYRHDYYHEKSYRKGIAELIVARPRETKKQSSCLLMWLSEYAKFANLVK